MSRATTARSGAPAVKSAARFASGYFQKSELPLTSLAFLLPFIILYELGTRYFAFDPIHHFEQRIIAFSLLQKFFALFGATGKYLPAAAVIVILLACHLVRRDSWQVDLRHLVGMLCECMALAVPLIALGFVAARFLPLFPFPRPSVNMLVLCIGAGIYEELVFRLIAFSVLSLVFIDLLDIKRVWGYLLMVVISSFLFSAYHYLGNEAFHWRSFVFRTAAGAYFGAVFACRGFGITAGTHSAYDVAVVMLRSMA